MTENEITFNNYKTCLFERQDKTISQNGFRSYKHQIYSESVTKIALSHADDKCYIKNNNVSCITYGNKMLKNKIWSNEKVKLNA